MTKRGTTLDTGRIEVDAFLHRTIEQLAVQEDERDVAGLVEYPPGFRVRRQNGQVSGGSATADPSPLQSALQPHVRAIIDAERRGFERRQADVHSAHAKAGRGNAVPSVLRADKRHLRSSEPMDELQCRPLRACQLARPSSTPPRCMRLDATRADNALGGQTIDGCGKDSQDFRQPTRLTPAPQIKQPETGKLRTTLLQGCPGPDRGGAFRQSLHPAPRGCLIRRTAMTLGRVVLFFSCPKAMPWKIGLVDGRIQLFLTGAPAQRHCRCHVTAVTEAPCLARVIVSIPGHTHADSRNTSHEHDLRGNLGHPRAAFPHAAASHEPRAGRAGRVLRQPPGRGTR